MSVFEDMRTAYRDRLDAANGTGFATLDPAALPPFVLVGLIDAPDPASGRGGIGSWRCRLPVVVAVPPPGDAAGVAAMGDALEQVWRTLGAAPTEAGPYTAPGRAELPAYTVTYPVDVPNPDC